MIVAHTDDELLWGWKDLLNEENWIVICIFQQYNYPNANNERENRLKAFQFTSNKFNFEYKIFNYEDNPYNLDINYNIQNKISEEIMKNIPLEYNKILTHNPDGEYGHYHHRIVSKIVTNLNINKSKLYYFSFNENQIQKFTDKYLECIQTYFGNNIVDETVIAHKELSKMVESIKYDKYISNNKLVYKHYPNGFLNCGIIKNKNYL